MIGAVVGLVVAVVGGLVILRFLFGLVATATQRSAPATGDNALCSVLEDARDRHTRRFAVAVVEPASARPIRIATVGCSADDVFEIGSVSKAVTGMLLADAEERGELSMSDPIEDVLPELAGRPIGRVAISALGEHRSGLPRLPFSPRVVAASLGYGILGLNPYAGQDVSSVIGAAGRCRLRSPVTTAYSNLGGALAGAVLERATASSYPDLVQQRLVAPLGLTHTSARPDAARRHGFTRWGQWVQPWRLGGYAPAGGVTSSIDDLATLAAALLRDAAAGARSIHRDDCFWVRERTPDGEPVTWHNGMTGGCAAYLGLRPTRARAVVVLSNVADMRLISRIAGSVASTE